MSYNFHKYQTQTIGRVDHVIDHILNMPKYLLVS
jgi:hypothetical protein